METSLTVIEQRTVEFYGDTIIAVRVDDGGVYVPIRPICDLLGVDWNGQRWRTNRDPVLSEEARDVDVTSIPGGTQSMICLPFGF